MNKLDYDTIFVTAWCLCIVTLPFTIPLNSFFIIALTLVWVAEGDFTKKWQRLKNASWAWPFLFFFALHVVGLLYSEHIDDGFFEVEKKLSFLAIPLIAATGRPLTKSSFDFLKKGFTYACLLIVIVSIILTGFSLVNHTTGPLQNFDAQTNQQFHILNPNASSLWEHFSYIELGDWIDIHPAYFSMYLIFCIIVLAQNMFDQMRIIFFEIIVIVVFTFFIVMLASRIAIVAYVIVSSYLALYNFIKKGNPKAILITVMFLSILCALIWINPVSRFRVIQEPLFTSFHIDQKKMVWNSVSFRLLEWRASLSTVAKSPILGTGTGDGQAALHDYYSTYNTSTTGLTYNAHNQYLQTTIELGLVGLLLLLICIFRPAFNAVQYPPIHIAFIILFGLMCITESVLARQKGIVFFTMFQSLFFRSTTS